MLQNTGLIISNSVAANLNDSSQDTFVVGGIITEAGEVKDNKVEITSTTINTAYTQIGAVSLAFRVQDREYIATRNTFKADNITCAGTLKTDQDAGGIFAFSSGNASASLTVSDNHAYLGTVNGSVGIINFIYVQADSGAQISVTGNNLYLYGASDLSNAEIFGVLNNSTATVTTSGNSLYFGYDETPWTSSAAGSADSFPIGSVRGFDNLVFSHVVWGKTITVGTFGAAAPDRMPSTASPGLMPQA